MRGLQRSTPRLPHAGWGGVTDDVTLLRRFCSPPRLAGGHREPASRAHGGTVPRTRANQASDQGIPIWPSTRDNQIPIGGGTLRFGWLMHGPAENTISTTCPRSAARTWRLPAAACTWRVPACILSLQSGKCTIGSHRAPLFTWMQCFKPQTACKSLTSSLSVDRGPALWYWYPSTAEPNA